MNSPDRTRRLVLLAIGSLGVSAVMTQLALLRELLSAFTGNELVLGIGLGSWLLLTGIGAWLGRFMGGVGRRALEPAPPGCRSELARESSPESPAPRYAQSHEPAEMARGPEPVERASKLLHPTSGTDRPPATGLFIAGLLCIALFPLLQVDAVRVLRDVIFIRGAAVGVTGTLLGTMALLLPFCLVSGILLTLACAVSDRSRDPTVIGRVYVADSIGSIGGGVLFSFVLVPWFDHFALLCFPAALNLLVAGVLAWHFRRRVLLGATVIIAAGLVAHVALINADQITTAIQYWGQPVLFRANSPYGRLVIIDDTGQLTFFENGVPVISTQNIEHVEETVHYPMSQRPDARKVLLISGGVTGTAREILRYGVEQVAYVELDPLIITAGRRFLPKNLADPRIRTIAADGRRFVQQTKEQFDVVIIDVPDPTTAQLNRFYTAEFYAEVRRILTPGGVVGFALGHYENYVSPELARLLASAYRTLRQSFSNVRMIPGGRVFFLASDGPLTLDIAAQLDSRGLATKFVNRHYLDATLAPDRLADLDRAVAQPAAINTDFAPALYYYQLRHWLSQFDSRAGLAGGVLALVLAIAYLLELRPIPRLIFSSGFTASAIEVVLLLGFQSLYGSLYQQVGLVVTVFMAGMAVGAWQANRTVSQGNSTCVAAGPVEAGPAFAEAPAGRPGPTALATGSKGFSTSGAKRVLPLGNRVCAVSCGLAALAALLPFILPRLGRIDTMAGTTLVGQGIILLVTFCLALLVGAQFPLAGASEHGVSPAGTASRLYTADLVGASLGALLVGTLLVPLFGITAVCLLTAALNLIAAVLAWNSMPSA
jgi:spermidine synthase